MPFLLYYYRYPNDGCVWLTNPDERILLEQIEGSLDLELSQVLGGLKATKFDSVARPTLRQSYLVTGAA